jgi:hypothetical protein
VRVRSQAADLTNPRVKVAGRRGLSSATVRLTPNNRTTPNPSALVVSAGTTQDNPDDEQIK